MTPAPNLPPEFADYKARAEAYVARAAMFPYDWGRPDGAKSPLGIPTDFFRYDAKQFRTLIERAEHIIRCLIIWMAMIRLRAGLIKTSNITGTQQPDWAGRSRGEPKANRIGEQNKIIFSSCSVPVPHASLLGAPAPARSLVNDHSDAQSRQPKHYDLTLRNIPLYEPKLPAFRISMPWPPSTRDRVTRPRTSRVKYRRPRNDTIQSQARLVERMMRLGKLVEQLDQRADRIARYWAGKLRPQIKAYRAELSHHLDVISDTETAPQLQLVRPELRPIKQPDPPDPLIATAPEDEREDLLALHDAALRAADRFYDLCG